MLETYSLESFAPHVESSFRVLAAPDQSVQITLVSAEDRGSTPSHECFSLLFRGPVDSFLPQRIYAMEHEVLGQMDLFLVPVGQEARGFVYEAIFNRLVNQA